MNIKGKIRIDSRAFISKENEDTEQTAAADRARASLVIAGECRDGSIIYKGQGGHYVVDVSLKFVY